MEEREGRRQRVPHRDAEFSHSIRHRGTGGHFVDEEERSRRRPVPDSSSPTPAYLSSPSMNREHGLEAALASFKLSHGLSHLSVQACLLPRTTWVLSQSQPVISPRLSPSPSVQCSHLWSYTRCIFEAPIMRVEEWGLGALLSWLVALNETLFYVVKEIKRKKTETPLKLIYPRHTHTHTVISIFLCLHSYWTGAWDLLARC